MIYKSDVNFPYPVLTNSSNSYKSCYFNLDVNLSENKDIYNIEINYDIKSDFIYKLLKDGQAKMFLIIQSIDNKFFEIKLGEKSKIISKNRMSLNTRTKLQLMIKSENEISFKENNDICGLYKDLKDDIVLPKNSVLAFSNVVTFNGSYKNGLDLFEKRVDLNIDSEIRIDLTPRSILITYKKEEMQFNDVLGENSLNNMYLYIGLQKALNEFILNNREYQDESEVIINDINEPESELDSKLYHLMKSKMITELNKDNIDHVIYLISDGIIEKFTNCIRRYVNDRG